MKLATRSRRMTSDGLHFDAEHVKASIAAASVTMTRADGVPRRSGLPTHIDNLPSRVERKLFEERCKGLGLDYVPEQRDVAPENMRLFNVLKLIAAEFVTAKYAAEAAG